MNAFTVTYVSNYLIHRLNKFFLCWAPNSYFQFGSVFGLGAFAEVLYSLNRKLHISNYFSVAAILAKGGKKNSNGSFK